MYVYTYVHIYAHTSEPGGLLITGLMTRLLLRTPWKKQGVIRTVTTSPAYNRLPPEERALLMCAACMHIHNPLF